MKLIHLLLFSEVIVARMVLHQPQDMVSVNVGATALISCVSNENIEDEKLITWYRKNTHKPTESPIRVKACNKNNDVNKYGCRNSNFIANLEIYRAQIHDSGVYYCTFWYASLQKISNGTLLIVRDNSFIYNMDLLQTSLNSSIQLACVVRTSLYTIHVTWNICGKHYKGSMTYLGESGGIRTFQNLLSLPRNYGDNVICEVWHRSPPLQLNWTIKEKGADQRLTIPHCSCYVRSVLILLYVLMSILTIHVSWNYY
ncbi:uncharacterized protein [Pyxicephalus adspersus]|uniref:uncharacterized protein n=1 Tax=Pyxicephalus adspersus TaxID=30357 RepID=UPI003B5BD14F